MTAKDKINKLWSIFGVASGILGFVVDSISFIELFGLGSIIAPDVNKALHFPPIIIKIPKDIELITFLIWLYTAVVVFIVSKRVASSYYCSDLESFLPIPFCILTPILFVIWLWGFGYISPSFYTLLLPTVAFLGFAWYTGLMDKGELSVGEVIIVLIVFTLMLFWLRSNYGGWSLLGTILVVCILGLIGGVIGFGISSGDWTLLDWIRYELLDIFQ